MAGLSLACAPAGSARRGQSRCSPPRGSLTCVEALRPGGSRVPEGGEMRLEDKQPDDQEHGPEAVWDEADDADLEDSLLAQVAQVSVPLRVPERGEHLGGPEGERFEILERLG